MTRRARVSTMFALLFLATVWHASAAFAQQTGLIVHGKDSRVTVGQKTITVDLAVGTSVGPHSYRVLLRLLAPDGTEQSSSDEVVQTSKTGVSLVAKVPAVFRIKKGENGATDLFAWYRIAYDIMAPGGETLASGILPVFSPAKDVFSIAVSAGRSAEPGRVYTVRASTATESHRPVSGVQLRTELSYEGDAGQPETAGNLDRLEAAAVTDARGEAVLRIKIPANLPGRDGQLSVTGRKGPLERTLTQDVRIGGWNKLVVETDKPIYQPGQTVHARALLFNSQHQAIDHRQLQFSVAEDDGTALLKQPLTTDAFGVIHTDWAIPDGTPAGQYSITVQDPEDDSTRNSEYVHLYRYDLPSFSVKATTDRRYYVDGQKPQVKVEASYLFGKPVSHGTVRVVEEAEGHWDSKAGKYVTEEAQVKRGGLDAGGQFAAEFDLARDFAELRDSSYRKYQDINFAAYVTDSSTGRSEQRHFTVRITREPIHVYINRDYLGLSPGFPADVFVATFYADGRPAKCRVELLQAEDEDKPQRAVLLQSVKTNKYGIAHVQGIRFRAVSGDNNFAVIARASDGKSAEGHDSETMYFDRDRPPMRVTTRHAIYRPGEPIEVVVEAGPPDRRIVIDVNHEGEILQSHVLKLKNGRAFTIFHYDPRMSGTVTITAYSLRDVNNDYRFPAGRVVLFPASEKLRVKVKLDRAEYRPGDNASAEVSVENPDHVGALSAIGLKIVDKAVEERAETDRQFGQRSWGSSWWSDAYSAFGSITLEDLNQIDLSEPIPDDLDEVADYVVNSRMDLPELSTADPLMAAADAFKPLLNSEFASVSAELKSRGGTFEYPHTASEFEQLARSAAGGELLDPWGSAYRYQVKYESAVEFLSVLSPGPDKQFGTIDDLTARNWASEYFSPIAKAIEQGIHDLFTSEDRFVRDERTLREVLLPRGIDIEKLRDPWGKPYRFAFYVSGSKFMTEVSTTAGRPENIPSDQRVTLWRGGIDYFQNARQHIDRVISDYLRKGGQFPETAEQFKAILSSAGVNLDQLTDPFGSPYFVTIETHEKFGDQARIVQRGSEGNRESVPVTLTRKDLVLHSAGMDRKRGTKDDFDVARFTALVSEQQSAETAGHKVQSPLILAGDTGGIAGVVLDPTGAVIPNAEVTVARRKGTESSQVKTDSAGRFEFRNLTSGSYLVTAVAMGFKTATLDEVPVRSGMVTDLSLTLTVGTATETVEVQASSEVLQTESASVSGMVARKVAPPPPPPPPPGVGLFTPRVRGNFPETMLWEPELVTNKGGHVALHFKMADNITTWKLTATASTKDGEMGQVEQYIRAFQPFFVEHDPPKVLTAGDEIAYPVVVRNYLPSEQHVRVSLSSADWFKSVGATQQDLSIPSGDSRSAVFRYRADRPIKEGLQRVTAANQKFGDAAEKPVDVRPDGRQESLTASDLITGRGTLALTVPDYAIPGTVRSRLVIYPSLLSHVVEAMDGLLERPWGCGEQLISSTYPSLLLLETARHGASVPPPMKARAMRYLQSGYERLLSYRGGGGFTYWGTGDPDLALTAYAYQFLTESSNVIEVDSGVITETESWLVKQQKADGSWGEASNDKLRNLQTTAYLAMVLAESPVKLTATRLAAVNKALQFIEANRALVLEPYIAASTALAAQGIQDSRMAESWQAWLRSHVHRETSATYWDLQENTPFYSWGEPGRVETTAVALRALASKHDDERASDHELISEAVLFILRNKDRYGVWYSGQTTVAAIESLLSLASKSTEQQARRAEYSINGGAAKFVASDPTHPGAITVDLSSDLKLGGNKIEITAPNGTSVSAELIIDYFVPWNLAPQHSSAPALRLSVNYSDANGSVGGPVTCHVTAERVGFRGYGMLLAEIGLPPGADVDRKSLEDMLSARWSVYRYEIMPDRVVFYVWPTAGGTSFDFKFSPRFAMNAQTAPSLLYDYYNPEARTVVRPTAFHVKTNSPTGATNLSREQR